MTKDIDYLILKIKRLFVENFLFFKKIFLPLGSISDL